jgi:ribosomal protein L29
VLEPSQERAVQRIVELKQRLADLQARLPAHSVPPAMSMEMEEIEEELAQLRTSLDSGKGCAAS